MKKKFVLILTTLLCCGCEFTFENSNIESSESNSCLDSDISESTSSKESEEISSNNKESSESISNSNTNEFPSSSSTSKNTQSSNNVNSSSSSTNIDVPNNENELLKQSDFNEISSWTFYKDDGKKLDIIEHGNHVLKLLINNNNTVNNWSVQLLQSPINLSQNNEYKVSFKVTSSITRDINFLLQKTDYSEAPLNEIIHLEANKEVIYEKSITLNSTSSYLYGFMFGNVNGTLPNDHYITLSNVSLKGKGAVASSGIGLNGSYDSAPQTLKNRQLVFNDEFNGNSLDTSIWNYDIGKGDWGWGNNEQQYYTSRKENLEVSNGSMKIIARKENYGNSSYTSSRINTKGKYQFHYGYIESRIALPSSSGIWPAFWMLGANIDQVSWPKCGEIDIMEAVNFNNTVHSTLHWLNTNDNVEANYGKQYEVNDRTIYHRYGLEWNDKLIITYVDDVKFYEIDISAGNGLEAFSKDFYFLFNVAVGGQWPGYNISNDFPLTMSVDYLRVYM